MCLCFSLLSLELGRYVPLIFFCPADHVPDWQPRVLLGMVEARSVNVKKTTTTTTYSDLLDLKMLSKTTKKSNAYAARSCQPECHVGRYRFTNHPSCDRGEFFNLSSRMHRKSRVEQYMRKCVPRARPINGGTLLKYTTTLEQHSQTRRLE